MPRNGKVRTGVIGAGRIGRIHAGNLARRVPAAEVAVVSDPRLDAARETAGALGIPKAAADHRAMLEDRSIDAVVICSPTDTHARIIREAAAAGKHIFCEKPIDLDLAVIRRAIAAADEARVKLFVGFNRRFDVNFRQTRERVLRGKIGKPEMLRITSRDPEPPPPDYIAASGGIFLDMTIHDFDMARFLLGEEMTEVYAAGGALIDPRIAELGDVDTAAVTMRATGGAICVIDNSRRSAYGYDQRVEVHGSKGCIVVGNVSPADVQLWDSAALKSALPHHFFLERYEKAYVEEMRDFVRCVLEDRPPSVSGEDGLKAALLGAAAKRSLDERRPVRPEELEEEVGV